MGGEGSSKALYTRGGPKSKPPKGTGSWAGDLAPSWTHSRPLPTAAGCVVSEALGGSALGPNPDFVRETRVCSEKWV